MLALAPAVALALVVQPIAHRAVHSIASATALPHLPPAHASPSFRARATIVCSTTTDEVSQVHADADAVFSVIDSDGNGAISKEELIAHLVNAGYKADAVAKIFEKLDLDKNGELSREELREGFIHYTPLRKAPGFGAYNDQFQEEIHKDADELFAVLDFDGDGEVTDQELRVHLRTATNFTDAAITNIFNMLDIDADGGITREELRSAFVRSSALRLAIGEGPNFK